MIDPHAPHGPLPWEDPADGRGRLARALATCGRVLNHPLEAGADLGSTKGLGPAVAFFAAAGLPMAWLAAANAQLAQVTHPDRQAAILRFLHLPEPPPPTAQQLAFTKIFGLFQLALYPFVAALGILLVGLLVHAGLWATRALVQGRGLETTFRAALYTSGATAWLPALVSFTVWLPDRLFWPGQLLQAALSLAILTLQGRVQAGAHGTEAWRGILGVFLPLLGLACLCGCCLGALGAGAAAVAGGR